MTTDFPRYVEEARLYGRHGYPALEWKASELFRRSQIPGGNALEIGAGDGVLSLWMLHKGARSVVSLEPEEDGHTVGISERAQEHKQRLGLTDDRWLYLGDTFQAYQPDRKFRTILSQASVNHLDEDACVRILDDEQARERYRQIFAKAHEILEPGGTFVLTDCARENLWAKIGYTCPFAPEIEWHKHQEPETWARLLRDAGFAVEDIRWTHPFYRVRTLGPLLMNRVAARCIASTFQLTARRRA